MMQGVIGSVAEVAVKEALARAKQNVDYDFESMLEMVKDFYDGHQDGDTNPAYFPQYVNESRNRYRQRKNDFTYINITAHITSKICQQYDGMVSREIMKKDQAENKEYSDAFIKEVERVWGDPQYTDDISKANNYSFLGIGSWAGVHWNEADSVTGQSWWMYDSIRFIQDALKPSEITHLITMNCTAESLEKSDDLEWVYTDETATAYLNGKQHGEVLDHGVESIPFIHMRNDYDWCKVWGIGHGEYLANANKKVNEKLTAIHSLGMDQSYTQLVFIDTDVTADKLGKNMPIKVTTTPGAENPAQVTTLQMSSDVAKLVEELKTYLDGVYSMFGMSNTSPMAIDTNSPQSGIAKYIEGFEVTQWQERIQRKRSRDEVEIARLIMKVLAASTNNKVDVDDYEIRVHFQDVKPILDPNADAAQFETDKAAGVTTDARRALERNPDLRTLEAAEEFVIENRVKQDQMQKETLRRIATLDTEATADETEESLAISGADGFIANGAQVTAAVDVVRSAGAGEISRESGIGVLMIMFQLSRPQAESLIGAVETVPEVSERFARPPVNPVTEAINNGTA